MKRSKKVKLTLMAGTALALSGCGDDRQFVENYKTLDACKTADVFTDAQCETAYKEAHAVHVKSSPRYYTSYLCQREFKATCEERKDNVGGSFWSPFMAGFLVSEVIKDQRSRYYHTPYYQSYGTNRGWYTWSGDMIEMARDSNGRYRPSISRKAITAKPKAAKVMSRTSAVSRGGFGSRSRSFGG